MAGRAPISHALRLGPIDAFSTKCGMKIRAGMSKRHYIAVNEAAATCVPCAAVVLAEQRAERAERGLVPHELEKYYEWASGPDSGLSSKTLVQAITGAHLLGWRDTHTPRDPSDFGRCCRVLRRFPELASQLDKVAAVHPEWRRLLDAWAELEALYEEELPTGRAPKLYARMQELANG